MLLAQDLTAWMQLLALDGQHTVPEPKRLRLHLFAIAGRLVRTARRRILDLDATWPWLTRSSARCSASRDCPHPA